MNRLETPSTASPAGHTTSVGAEELVVVLGAESADEQTSSLSPGAKLSEIGPEKVGANPGMSAMEYVRVSIEKIAPVWGEATNNFKPSGVMARLAGEMTCASNLRSPELAVITNTALAVRSAMKRFPALSSAIPI